MSGADIGSAVCPSGQTGRSVLPMRMLDGSAAWSPAVLVSATSPIAIREASFNGRSDLLAGTTANCDTPPQFRQACPERRLGGLATSRRHLLGAQATRQVGDSGAPACCAACSAR